MASHWGLGFQSEFWGPQILTVAVILVVEVLLVCVGGFWRLHLEN